MAGEGGWTEEEIEELTKALAERLADLLVSDERRAELTEALTARKIRDITRARA